jgi:hypothetical protein
VLSQLGVDAHHTYAPRYFARVLIGNTAWVVGESSSAAAAARLHDLAAMAVFGVSALLHVNTPPPYSYDEMAEVVQSLARQVRWQQKLLTEALLCGPVACMHAACHGTIAFCKCCRQQSLPSTGCMTAAADHCSLQTELACVHTTICVPSERWLRYHLCDITSVHLVITLLHVVVTLSHLPAARLVP